jgi:DNA (cytosine-5)-methyltransferase 1
MSALHVVSLFAGIGGIDRGFALAGATTVLLCELDPHARGILTRHYPRAAVHNDITELTADDLRAAGAVPGRTVVCAGFPCQDLSVAGGRRGMGEGTRSGLYWHVDRLLAEFRPAWVVLENVPGLLSAVCPCPGDGRCPGVCPGEFHTVVGGACAGGCIPVHGGAMGAILGSLAERGYGFAYRVLDARHFGVPQRRRRVVIVGRLGDTGAAPAQVLLEPEGVPGNPAQGITPRPGPAADAGSGTAIGVLGDHAHSLTAEGADASEDGTGRGTPVIGFAWQSGGNRTSSGAFGVDESPTMPKSQTMAVAYASEHTTALDTAQGGPDDNTAQGGQLVAFSLRGRDEGAVPEVHKDGQTIGSLRASGGGSSRDYVAHTIIRRLTPVECERLQGYPDGWTEGQADSQRYKQLGNSVAVPVFEWVARRLVAVDRAIAGEVALAPIPEVTQ